MAKKQFNFRQTLKKKTEAEQPTLAKKVDLPKTQKDPEAIKQRVAEIHGDEVINPATPTPASKSTPKRNTPKKKATAKAEKQVRITIDMPATLHRTVKIKAITENTTIRGYILGLIARDMK